MRTPKLLRRSVALTALLAACEHSTPFRPGDYGPEGPFAAGSPTRLTYNPGQDLQPAWLSDGGIVYTAERSDRADHDRCLAFLPAGGGAIRQYICETTTADDSINVFEDVAARDHRVAYVRVSTDRLNQGRAPDTQELVVTSSGEIASTRVLQPLPLTTPWGQTYDGFSHIVWLDSTHLIALAERITRPRPCPTCARDTIRTGLEIVAIDIAGSAVVLALVPETNRASSLAIDSTGDTLHFTRNGDSRVFRLVRSAAREDTVYDFGSLGIARDIAVVGGQIVAIVGGDVIDTINPVLGEAQTDHGGPLYSVSAGGSAVRIGDPAWIFRRPALSGDGRQLAVAAWVNGSPTADVWLFELR